MPVRNQAVIDHLARRQSLPAKTFSPPVPSRSELEEILALALRVPDHGKLEPWRIVVLDRGAMARLADIAEVLAQGDPERVAKGRGQYDAGHLALAVIVSPKPVEKIPADEQVLSAGALCMNILHAATAHGWAACWLTGWPAHDANFRARAFGCTPDERVAGILHIGTAGAPPPDRPRPDLGRVVTWPDSMA
jgi:nitroreductase